MKAEVAKLDVLICTYGKEGIERVSASSHPEVEGVKYVVSWQINDKEAKIPENLKREDFEIFISDSKGLSLNRNIALTYSSAPLSLIADDDVDYTSEQLKRIIELFNENPTTDLITFKYLSSEKYTKNYPSHSFNLKESPKGYFATSFEIAFRTQKIKDSKLQFNENFGIGAPVFCCGEEDIFIREAIREGVECRFFPEILCTHMGSTTSDRVWNSPNYLMTKGAVVYHSSPKKHVIRLIIQGLRSQFSGKTSFFRFIHYTLKGVSYARQHQVFAPLKK